jgi:hypothetical protein
MGYRYGEHRYGEGLYSRWPDWWHDKSCLGEEWKALACEPVVAVPAPPPPAVWTPVDGHSSIWAPSVPVTPPWAPVPLQPSGMTPSKAAPPFKLAGT